MSLDLEQLIREARETLPKPSAGATARARQQVLGSLLQRRRGRLRATAAVVVLALMTVGGVAAGLWVAPSGEAADERASGLGFLPASGWTIMQSGALSSSLSAIAVAANVPLHPDDLDGGLPYKTLQSLPPNGVVITASFVPAAPPFADTQWPRKQLPLRLADFAPDRGWSAQARASAPLAQRNLRARINGYHVNLHAYFGTTAPTPRMLAEAQRQLAALIVAGNDITIEAQPTAVPWAGRVRLTGVVASGRAGEDVTLEERWCGLSAFSEVAQTRTGANGAWHLEWTPTINTTIRVRSKGSVSSTISLRTRPGVTVYQKTRRQFKVDVFARKSFWQRSANLERFDRRRNRWTLVKRFRLTKSNAVGVMQLSSAKVRARVPRNVLVRVVFPASQTRGCYLAGYSNMLRTR